MDGRIMLELNLPYVPTMVAHEHEQWMRPSVFIGIR